MTYLDHNATSIVHPAVREAMEPWWGCPANPSSVHGPGRRAAAAVERAAEHVAALVGKEPREVVFTSGATEANRHWLHALSILHPACALHVGATEHPSLLQLPGVQRVEVDADGRHRFDGCLPAWSIMAANHETGVQSDLEALSRLGGVGHIDATAAAGRMELALDWVDAVTLSAHKIGGPMGVGALVARERELPALFQGSQQRARRGGTVPTPLVVGFGEAARLACLERDARLERWRGLQERLEAFLLSQGARIVGRQRLPTVVNAVFEGLPAETLVQALDLQGIAVSAGSACASGSVGPSPVLQAMADPEPAGGVRFSFGWSTTQDDIEAVERVLPSVLDGARLFL